MTARPDRSAEMAGYRRLAAALLGEGRSLAAKSVRVKPEKRTGARYISRSKAERRMVIKVGCRPVDLRFTSAAAVQRRTRKAGSMGCNDYESNLILVVRGLPESTRAVTMMHESLHDINSSYSMDLSEQTVDTLATSIVTLLRDNRELADMILGRKT